MSSYLQDVRTQFEQQVQEMTKTVWIEIMEPAIKQSFKNGLGVKEQEAGRGHSRTRPAGSRRD